MPNLNLNLNLGDSQKWVLIALVFSAVALESWLHHRQPAQESVDMGDCIAICSGEVLQWGPQLCTCHAPTPAPQAVARW